ncbi:MAG: DUF84 family protein [bacterium]|nr:DUF84 family protein [bacterium]
MSGDLREFWNRHQEGVDVAVASSSSGVLLGVRDGFQRFLSTSFERVVPVAIVAQPPVESSSGLPVGEEETLALARLRAAALEERLGDEYHFYLGAEGGLSQLELSGESAYFVHCWVALRGLADETWGSSGSLQVPRNLIAGLEKDDVIAALPATRRRGGMLAALSQGRETRRTAVALAVFHALTSRFFGILGSRVMER